MSAELKPLTDPDLMLSHFSKEPVLSVHSVKQEWPASEFEKPRGLWLSVDGEHSWEEWCESENFGIGPIRHRVVLAPAANILYCRDALDLDCLTERYGVEVPGYSWRRIAIEWHRIADEYQGIIITPYIWERRLHDAYLWYYGWDCASGCIWDAGAVAECFALQRDEKHG